MLPINMLIVSMAVVLVTTVSTAPVEEKEQEEAELETTEEGERSEEEEDDEDSKSQDKIEGLIGVRQTTTTTAAAAAAVASGGSGAAAGVSSNSQDLSASSSQSAGGGTRDGTAGSSTGHGSDSSSVHSAAAEGQSSSAASQPTGNGQKFLNGRVGADSQTDPAHLSDISINQSGPGHTSLISAPDQSLSSSVSGSAYSAARGASGLGLGHEVTESTPTATGTLHSVSGGYSHPDLVTVAIASTGTDTVSADPTGSPLESSHPAVTDHTQMAGSVTEQYHPSGPGPEGAENVELEDTC